MTSCTRCGGFVQWARVHWRSRLTLLSCVNCGDRVDAVILANRRWQAQQETQCWQTTTWDRILTLVAEEVSA